MLRKTQIPLKKHFRCFATLTRGIANYPCISEASTSNHYTTSGLQYSVVKIFKNLNKLTVRRLQAHKIYPAYELTPLHLLNGPLKHFEQSTAIETLSTYTSDHLEILLQHILHTDPDEMLMKKYNNNVELFSRMCKALEHFISLTHPQTCVKCNFDLRLGLQYSTSPTSLTCVPSNTLHL